MRIQFNNDKTLRGVEGYYEYLSKNRLHIHIYGTNHWRDWVSNFNAFPLVPLDDYNWPKDMPVHAGWYGLAKEVFPLVLSFVLEETKEIIFTGHSLGGGICEILAVMMWENKGCLKISLDLYGGTKGITNVEGYFKSNGIGYTNIRLGYDIVPFLSPFADRPGGYKYYPVSGKFSLKRLYEDHQPNMYQPYSVWKL